ncbi:hypothetical protein AWC38_SpisGene3053 [Stylophora pistillata]|uniref:Uncharacterized protein n=1 Tax=Stylophora pistillata TaxID=50429 RepID=A0A2B4ST36_STYPI|nr:hypothetical protein AWC38_SpisGene3053 [Stylophora pistillata]
MSFGWVPPKEDSPSVISNRVFTVRRLNKMESKRLGTQLNILKAEEEHFKSLISHKQQILKKELSEIRQVKENPTFGIERRKLLQQISCKETRQYGSAGQNTERSRTLSAGESDRKEELSTDVKKKPWGLHNNICTTPSEGWPKISASVNRNSKSRQRSLSTGVYPHISAWGGNRGNDGLSVRLGEDDFWGSDGIKHEGSGLDHRCRSRKLSFEFSQSTNWTWRGRRHILNKDGATMPGSEFGVNSWQKRGEEIRSSQKSLTGGGERRQRSYSTNYAPNISGGRVFEVCQGLEQNKLNAQDLCSTRAVKSGRRRYTTNCRPKVSNGKVIEISGENKSNGVNSYHQVTTVRRQRSLTVNCPPVCDSSKDKYNLLDFTDDKKANNSSCEREENAVVNENIVNDGLKL